MLAFKPLPHLRSFLSSRKYSVNVDEVDIEKHVAKLSTTNRQELKDAKGFPVYSIDTNAVAQPKPIDSNSGNTILTKALKKVFLKRQVKEEKLIENYNEKVKQSLKKGINLAPEMAKYDIEKADQAMRKLKIGVDTKKKALNTFSGKIEYLHTFTVEQFQSVLADRETIKRTVQPYSKVPQVCFIGRSNVGKSSLINALLGKRDNLLKVSQTPGRTQSLSMVMVNKTLIVVDMPGYGFASIPPKKRKLIRELSNHYLLSSLPVHVFILVDARRGVEKLDLELMDFLDERKIPHQIILTKVDKLKKGQLEKIEEEAEGFSKKRFYLMPELMYTSSKDKVGIDELRHQIYLASGVEERKYLLK